MGQRVLGSGWDWVGRISLGQKGCRVNGFRHLKTCSLLRKAITEPIEDLSLVEHTFGWGHIVQGEDESGSSR
eukprot:164286-Rhodomonas_salina.2